MPDLDTLVDRLRYADALVLIGEIVDPTVGYHVRAPINVAKPQLLARARLDR